MPCFKRYKDIESLRFQETLIDENDGEGGWVDTQYYSENKDDAEITLGEEALEEQMFSGRGSKASAASAAAGSGNTKAQANISNPSNHDDDDDDSEAEDIENFLSKGDDFGAGDLNELNDNSCPIQDDLAGLSLKDDENNESEFGPSDIVSTRTYDLYITYDKYYQTPRLWFVGFDEFCKPLTIEQMFEDIR